MGRIIPYIMKKMFETTNHYRHCCCLRVLRATYLLATWISSKKPLGERTPRRKKGILIYLAIYSFRQVLHKLYNPPDPMEQMTILLIIRVSFRVCISYNIRKMTCEHSRLAKIISEGEKAETHEVRKGFPFQWEFQDPTKMEVLYHIRPYFVGIFPYIGLI